MADHLRRYSYAAALGKLDKDAVVYVNLDEGRFIQDVGRILAAGYVLTIDYGSDWEGMIAPGPFSHLRSYGPGSQREKSDPYRNAGLNDITTDVNFSLLAAEGQSAGLKTVFCGRQRALQSGTPIGLHDPAPDDLTNDSRAREYASWVEYFRTSRAFKMLIQQKDHTDPGYVYPDSHIEQLEANQDPLGPPQRKKAGTIGRKLRAADSAGNSTLHKMADGFALLGSHPQLRF